MHLSAYQFFERLSRRLPQYFNSAVVVEIGSLNINGTLRPLFHECQYTGVDLEPGPCVDVCSLSYDYKHHGRSPDIVISSNALEHDRYRELTLGSMVRLVRPGGLVAISAAGPGFQIHGTRNTTPDDSPFTSRIDGWCDYYQAVTPADLDFGLASKVNFRFSKTRSRLLDTFFWGIKR